MANLEKFLIGTIEFDSKDDIIVSDPCYDDDVWCRKDIKKLKPGTYRCYAWVNGKGVVLRSAIYREGVKLPRTFDLELIGNIGVDAGMAGYFKNKPNYNNAEWHTFCDELLSDKYRKKYPEIEAFIRPEGFFTDSGYGDGDYPVFGYEENGELVGIEIAFN